MPHACLQPLNGRFPYRKWALKLPTVDTWRYGSNSDRTITRFEVFLQLFPSLALNTMVFSTNHNLKKNCDQKTNRQELLRFIGINILATKYEWNDRSDLWSKTKPSKYEASPDFGTLIGISRN
jgi:Transposase IS4